MIRDKICVVKRKVNHNTIFKYKKNIGDYNPRLILKEIVGLKEMRQTKRDGSCSA